MTLQEIIQFHQVATSRSDVEALVKVEKAYLAHLEKYPKDAQILQLLGTLYMQIQKNPLGIQILERCVQLDPKIGEAWNNLGNAYRIDHHKDLAEACFEKAVECDPTNGEHLNNWGTNYVNEGRPAKGEEILRKAVKYKPENPHAHWNLALVLLEQGKYEEGFSEYKHGKDAQIRFERFYGCPEWDGKETDHLVIYGEQGLGDEIMYCSILSKIDNVKKITVDGHPRLKDMMERAYPHIEFYPTRKEPVIDWALDKKFTARIAMGDLPKFYIKTWKDFDRKPYLKSIKRYEVPKPAIGFSWEGGRKKTRNDLRSITLDEFAPIIKSRPDVQWVSLQYTPDAKERVVAFNKKYGTNIIHYPYVHEFNYDCTLSLVRELDQVITVNTSLVHLCGAAGVKTKVLTPFGKAWRYFSPDGKHLAWYGDHLEIYQQVDSWQPVIERIVHDLQQEAHGVTEGNTRAAG